MRLQQIIGLSIVIGFSSSGVLSSPARISLKNTPTYDPNSIDQNEKILKLLLRLAYHTEHHLIRLKNEARERAENAVDKSVKNVTLKQLAQGIINGPESSNVDGMKIQNRLFFDDTAEKILVNYPVDSMGINKGLITSAADTPGLAHRVLSDSLNKSQNIVKNSSPLFRSFPNYDEEKVERDVTNPSVQKSRLNHSIDHNSSDNSIKNRERKQQNSTQNSEAKVEGDLFLPTFKKENSTVQINGDDVNEKIVSENVTEEVENSSLIPRIAETEEPKQKKKQTRALQENEKINKIKIKKENKYSIKDEITRDDEIEELILEMKLEEIANHVIDALRSPSGLKT